MTLDLYSCVSGGNHFAFNNSFINGLLGSTVMLLIMIAL